MKRVFTQTFGVVGAILERDGKILLVKEAQKIDHGKWSHPAGWIDVGENPIEAVKRDTKEESGFDFEPTHILGIYSLLRKGKEKELGAIPHAIKIIFIGNISDKQSKELHEDVSETKWFTPEEIYQMDSKTLRDVDIKEMVKAYFEGKKYSLDLLVHTEQDEG
jgi:ADP-ribose pyrophosphatase YjhB (NUDIX family)